jgi:predicted regulator of Ras-like GTPase activity (Roadblock/LC7/MglB family)
LLLRERLRSVTARWHQIDGLLLVDASGLPLASTLESRALEERLAALASLAVGLVERAQCDLDLGTAHVLHLAAQDRQFFLVPVYDGLSLVAVAEAEASPGDITRQLMSTVRDLLALPDPGSPAEERHPGVEEWEATDMIWENRGQCRT